MKQLKTFPPRAFFPRVPTTPTRSPRDIEQIISKKTLDHTTNFHIKDVPGLREMMLGQTKRLTFLHCSRAKGKQGQGPSIGVREERGEEREGPATIRKN